MFTAPAGFGLVNTPQAVIARGTSGQAEFATGPYSGNLDAYLEAALKAKAGNTPVALGAIQRADVNGIKSATARIDANAQSGPVSITIVAYELAPDSAFHFFAVAPRGGSAAFEPLFASFRRLTATEAAAIKPRKVDVVMARSGDTVASLSARMAYPEYREERFRTLNALGASGAVRSGQRYKLIVY
jgi:predicted Zn-dependent protease